jgi:hypothetical protein
MKTAEKYQEMGIVETGKGKVQDAAGKTYYTRKARSPLKAIRQFCAECQGMDRRNKKAPFPFDDIRKCTDPMCPLFDFRLGKNPFVGRPMSEEQKKASAERFKMFRDQAANKDLKKSESD